MLNVLCNGRAVRNDEIDSIGIQDFVDFVAQTPRIEIAHARGRPDRQAQYHL